MENWVAPPSWLGEEMPVLKELLATAPAAWSLPQAPHVCQAFTSSRLSITVDAAAGVPEEGAPEDGEDGLVGFWATCCLGPMEPPPQATNVRIAEKSATCKPAGNLRNLKTTPGGKGISK